ncbi:Uncharacterized conserved protein YlxW, UPF0749 family [Streptomyces melanosporofaciens]|uniref:Uncharacterized conserved protein YlxW, UPF0749 family n=1 Tax=Streptomyces melanosporofaciens TaxID=67327 RepID=A0A1H5ANP2_STRMJ|nr:Uncharacterized conserved protein YlxW, UPF0749 family [Streptomyces melanosporofaciens]
MTTDDTPEQPERPESAENRRSAETPRLAEREEKPERPEKPEPAAKAGETEPAAEPPRRSPEPPRRPETAEKPAPSGEPEPRERARPERPSVAETPRPGTPSPARKPEHRDVREQPGRPSTPPRGESGRPAGPPRSESGRPSASQRSEPGRPAGPPPGGFKDVALRTPLPKAVLPEALPPQAQGRPVKPGGTPTPPAEGTRPPGGPRSGPGERVGPAPGPGAGQGGRGAEKGSEEALSGRQRLLKGVWPPRLTRAQLIVALLLFGLGLGLAIQVRSTNENSVLRGARQEDLVRILDELDSRTQRLQDEKRRLENQRTELENSSDQAEEARKQTLQKEQQLGVLAGTVAAQGPGITITIDDSRGSVESDMLLDTVQELRAAGAEAIQIGKVRVVAGTYFADSGGAIQIDGRKVTQPYVVKVIGKPEDLEPALNIPGGVVQSLEKEQATVSVRREKKIVVDALRSAKRPDYARSSSR